MKTPKKQNKNSKSQCQYSNFTSPNMKEIIKYYIHSSENQKSSEDIRESILNQSPKFHVDNDLNDENNDDDYQYKVIKICDDIKKFIRRSISKGKYIENLLNNKNEKNSNFNLNQLYSILMTNNQNINGRVFDINLKDLLYIFNDEIDIYHDVNNFFHETINQCQVEKRKELKNNCDIRKKELFNKRLFSYNISIEKKMSNQKFLFFLVVLFIIGVYINLNI